MPTTYTIEGVMLGEGPNVLTEDGHLRTSVAVVCPACGDVWAKIERKPKSFWTHWARTCTKCSGGYESCWPAGSVWFFDKDAEDLPKAVLSRELTLYLNWAENGAIIMTPELQDKVRMWRQKALDNTLTEADMIEAVKALRAGRMAASMAAAASKTKKAKAAGPVVDGNALLDEMMGGDA